MCIDTWYYNIPKGCLNFVSEIDRTAEHMAYLALEMCERGDI